MHERRFRTWAARFSLGFHLQQRSKRLESTRYKGKESEGALSLPRGGAGPLAFLAHWRAVLRLSAAPKITVAAGDRTPFPE